MKIAFVCIFKKFEKGISFKFIFQKLNFGKLVKINFIFRFYFSIISSHQLFCVLFNATLFEDIIIHSLIDTFRLFYKKLQHKNIIFHLFYSKFFRICVSFISNGVLGTSLALKLSKSFTFQGLIQNNIQQLSLNPRKLQRFLGKRKHQCLECSPDYRLRMIIGSE